MCGNYWEQGTKITIMLNDAKDKYPSHSDRMDGILQQLEQNGNVEQWAFVESAEDIAPQGIRDEMISRLVSMVNAWFTPEERNLLVEGIIWVVDSVELDDVSPEVIENIAPELPIV